MSDSKLPDELSFLPTEPQRRAKSAFWAKYSRGGTMADPSELDLATVVKFVGHKSIPTWWEEPGFREWFVNEHEFIQKMEYIAYMCQDRMIEMLKDKRVNPSAVVSMMKMVFEVAEKYPRKSEKELFLDEAVSQMNRAQLEEFIAKGAKLVGLPAQKAVK